jgi:predicted metal-dependent HD superfamily phosphohydrolase
MTVLPDITSLVGAARHFCAPYYREAHRAYHGHGHVQAMLEALNTRGVLTPALELAVWGHDLICDPRHTDNEQQSAQLFSAWMISRNALPDLTHDVARLILETRHLQPPSDRAAALLIDADLSVFGANDEAFRDYEAAIRQEYDWVGWPTYRDRRAAVLTRFLAQDKIYATPEFAGLEEQARRHLAAAINRLSAAEH